MTHPSGRLLRVPLDLDSDEHPIAAALEGAAGQAACPHPDLVRLLDAEVLPADVVAVVRQHVGQCKVCQALAFEGVIGPDEAEASAARRRVWARIEPGVKERPISARHFWRRPAWAWVAAPAFGAALAAVVFLIARVPVDVPPVAHVPVVVVGRATALLAASVLQPSRPVFPAPEVVRLRGDTRPQPGARGQIAQALAGTGGDFAAALPALELIAARHPESPEALICFGVALIEAGRAADAVAPVTRARSLSQGPVADEAEWFLAVALAHSRRGREAADVLRPLCERPGERQAIACAGLRELEGVPAR
jgi:hypothetical protein